MCRFARHAGHRVHVGAQTQHDGGCGVTFAIEVLEEPRGDPALAIDDEGAGKRRPDDHDHLRGTEHRDVLLDIGLDRWVIGVLAESLFCDGVQDAKGFDRRRVVIREQGIGDATSRGEFR